MNDKGKPGGKVCKRGIQSNGLKRKTKNDTVLSTSVAGFVCSMTR